MNESLKFRADNTESFNQNQLNEMNKKLELRLIENGINPNRHRDDLDFEDFQVFRNLEEKIFNEFCEE